ncbi:MAG TPA: cytochrome c [Stellaceae bacterium]|jgi:mono/diheme cytochrome c family protein|nr:cytochrome c [Stellaceae bacterium]
MKIAFAIALAMLTLTRAACADGLTQDDYQYLQKMLGLTEQSAALTELTPNEQQALHSAINDLSRYPESRDLQVKRYLALVYGRECKRWAAAHPGGTKCSPAADQAIEPGKEISDKICATCHLFGGDAVSFHSIAGEKDWDSHKLEHALRHTQGMVPIKLTQEQLDALTAYVNSFKSP